MQHVFKYLLIFLFILGTFEDSSFAIPLVSQETTINTSIITPSLKAMSDMDVHHQQHDNDSATDDACPSQQCHTCHASHCFMVLVFNENLPVLTFQQSVVGYKFSYSYLFAKVFKRPPIAS